MPINCRDVTRIAAWPSAFVARHGRGDSRMRRRDRWIPRCAHRGVIAMLVLAALGGCAAPQKRPVARDPA